MKALFFLFQLYKHMEHKGYATIDKKDFGTVMKKLVIYFYLQTFAIVCFSQIYLLFICFV